MELDNKMNVIDKLIQKSEQVYEQWWYLWIRGGIGRLSQLFCVVLCATVVLIHVSILYKYWFRMVCLHFYVCFFLGMISSEALMHWKCLRNHTLQIDIYLLSYILSQCYEFTGKYWYSRYLERLVSKMICHVSCGMSTSTYSLCQLFCLKCGN